MHKENLFLENKIVARLKKLCDKFLKRVILRESVARVSFANSTHGVSIYKFIMSLEKQQFLRGQRTFN